MDVEIFQHVPSDNQVYKLDKHKNHEKSWSISSVSYLQSDLWDEISKNTCVTPKISIQPLINYPKYSR